MTIASIHGDTEFIRVYNFLKFCISFQAIENLLSLYYFLLSDKEFPYETEIYWYFWRTDMVEHLLTFFDSNKSYSC